MVQLLQKLLLQLSDFLKHNLLIIFLKKWSCFKNVVSKISECFCEIGSPYEDAEIDRVHRLGKPDGNENSDLIMKPIIIIFKSWR